MSTALLRLAGPLQAWGSSSRFKLRATEREPTKSGILGLVAAALGRRRTDPVENLRRLNFGVRIDQVGALIKDYHTAHTFDGKQSFVSDRYYLADAVFLAGLEGDETLLREIDAAIRRPAFPLFLGRRSCPPAGPIALGVREGISLVEALRDEPWLAGDWYKEQAPSKVNLEIVYDANLGETGVVRIRDWPISFYQTHRKYGFRSAKYELAGKSLENPNSRRWRDGERSTAHNPFAELDVLNIKDE